VRTNDSAARHRGVSRRWLGGALALALAASVPSSAQVRDGGTVTAAAVKAAFLYKFVSYVEWPRMADAAAPITIGVADADRFADEITETTRGRTVAGRPIAVVVLDDADSLDGVQILFVGGQSRSSELLEKARGLPILTVTESRGAPPAGSIINFTEDRERVRFEISLYSAEQSQLKLNSRLLAVADAVHRGPE
jgi:hypothetical protein